MEVRGERDKGKGGKRWMGGVENRWRCGGYRWRWGEIEGGKRWRKARKAIKVRRKEKEGRGID